MSDEAIHLLGLPLPHAGVSKCYFGFNHVTVVGSYTKYCLLNDRTSQTLEVNAQTPIVAGTFKSLRVNCFTYTLDAGDLTLTLRVNGVSSALVLHITGTGIFSVTQDVAVSTDDLVNLMAVAGGTSAGQAKFSFCVEFEPS